MYIIIGILIRYCVITSFLAIVNIKYLLTLFIFYFYK